MRKYIWVALFLGATITVKAQQEISYSISFPNLVHHEAEVSMTIPNVPANAPLQVRFARSSPGRYATHEFGKNIYSLKAFDEQGNLLALKQPSTDVYEITKPSGKVKITYTVFGNWVDGTYAAFDETHAHMNIPAVFAFPIGMDKRARTITFNHTNKPEWKVATQLEFVGSGIYRAKDFQYFMDSPIELANYKTASWDVKDANGKKQTIHLMAHSDDDKDGVNNYAEMLKKMTAEQHAVWGVWPTFDEGHYYFMHCVHPSNAGDGMEHRNSTVITQRTPKIAGYEANLIGTFSHEFFHAWNVERLRPKTLEPFNFTQSNISDELWIAEGFTQYYGNLTLKRAGLRSLESIAQTFTGFVNTVTNAPGAKNFSPIQASRYAVFADAGVAVDQTNKQNIFASYYTYGAAVGLALDLRLRADFNLSLDNYMQALWKAYGQKEIPYNIPGLEQTLGELTKNPAFAHAFFKSFVYGTEKEDYTTLLLKAGLVVKKQKPGTAFSGIERLALNNANEVTLPATLAGTPAYQAGLNVDDVLLKVGNTEIKSQQDFTKLLEKQKPGEKIDIIFSRKGVERVTQLVLVENPNVEVVTIESTGGTLTPEMQLFRAKWLESAVK